MVILYDIACWENAGYHDMAHILSNILTGGKLLLKYLFTKDM